MNILPGANASESSAETTDSRVQSWLNKISESRKCEKDFLAEGRRITKIYEAHNPKATPFNILYSNTETLSPALYSQVPRPVVQRRYKDKDPLGAAVSEVLTRTLQFELDDGMASYADFDTLMKNAVLEALVPGRGITRIKYDADISEAKEAVEADPANGIEASEASPGSLNWETVCGEEVPWDRFVTGYAKTWKDVQWIAFEHVMDKDDLKENFGAEVAAQIKLTHFEPSSQEMSAQAGYSDHPLDAACVYEVWDKKEKKVFFVSDGYRRDYLKPPVDDPLGLSGFFPCPEPLKFFARVSSLTPVSLYTFYEEQAAELNTLTIRIKKIIQAIKARGFYDSSIQGMEALFSSDDNELLPADNVAALEASGGLQNAIWMVPVEKLVQVLQSLYAQRESCKAVIYEIMGISDILRGASKASETAAAQNIKSQWGSLRLKRMQKEVMRYSRDLLRIMVEVSAGKLSPDTIKQMTGLQFMTEQEKQQAQQFAQANPEQAQQISQQQPELLEMLSKPSWEQIFQVMSNDVQRSYKVDVETNSTLDADATEDKTQITEFMGAFSQTMIALTPLVQAGTLPFEAGKSIMLAIIRRFQFGSQVETELEQMQPPQPQQSPEVQKQAEDLAKKEEDLNKKEQDLNQQEGQLKVSQASAKAELDSQAKVNQMSADYATKELALQAEFNKQTARLEKQINDLQSLTKASSIASDVGEPI